MKSGWPEWLWGDVPSTFQRISLSRQRMMLVRKGMEPYLCLEHFQVQSGPESGEPEASLYGREKLRRFSLRQGETALVRTYRHGGLARRLTGRFFFTWPPRPFVELAVAEEARQRGIPTAEVLGAAVDRVWGPFYRGWLITRELERADPFWEALRNDRYGNGERPFLIRSVAECVCQMHRRGLLHGDLNLRNILVRREADEIRSYVIDLDKGRLFPGPVPAKRAKKNLDRLLRSVRKLDPARRHFLVEEWSRFMRCYREAGCG